MKAVHFGAGNIGRGFIGYLLSKSKYEVTFVDISDSLVYLINKYKRYTVITLNISEKKESIEGVKAISLKDANKLEKAVEEADLITTSIGANNLKEIGILLSRLLEKRLLNNQKELDIIACENALMATDIIKNFILEHGSEQLKKYLNKYVGFPNSAVDRIVPNVDIKKELDIDVAVENFYEWDIEKGKVKINSNIKGAEYVENLEEYIERKLFLLNGAHATIAYLGYLKGYEFIHEAIKDENIKKVILGFHKEAINALNKKYKIHVDELMLYSNKIIERFQNKYFQDSVSRVGRDPARKLSYNDRLITPLRLCHELNIEKDNILTGIAASLLFNCKNDNKSQEVQNIIKNSGIKDAVIQITGLEVKSPLIDLIVNRYERLKRLSIK